MAQPSKLRLGEHCLKIGSGATPRGGKDAYLEAGPFSLIRSQNILNERFSHRGLAFISQDQADQLSNVEVLEGDVLLNITGDSVARVCQVDPTVLPARVNQHVAIIRPNPKVISAQFLRYYLVSNEMQTYMLGLAASGATRNALTKGMIEDFTIPNIPIAIQRKVASVLGSLDDKIESSRKLNETLEDMARALFRDWFVDFGPTRATMEGREPYLSADLWSLFPDRLDEEQRPVNWKASRLGNFTDLQNGFAFKSSDWLPQGIPVVKIGSVKPSLVDIEQVSYISAELALERNAFRLRVGDVLVGLTGYVGETGRVPPTDNAPLLNQRVGRFSTDGAFSPFVYACVRDSSFKIFAEAKAHGSAQPNVSTRDLLDFPVVDPGPAALHAFNQIVGPLFEKSLANAGEIASLMSTRDYLLLKLMSGEITVRDAEKSVSEAA